MVFVPNIKIGETVKAERIYEEFGCQRYKGIMHSASKNALVLVSDRVKGIYKDRWDNDILYYTGTGQIGNQVMDSSHGNNNAKLANSRENGLTLYLFEKLVETQYTYRGIVKLARDYYVDSQLDANGDMRDVFIFPLQLEMNSSIDQDDYRANLEIRTRLSKKKTDEELFERVKSKQGKANSVRNVKTTVYERDEDIAEYVKRRAKGICDLCGNKAPFENRKNEPYLEEHHIKWLSEGGDDSIENAVALCPNCHRKMHVLNSCDDRDALYNRLYAYGIRFNDMFNK